MATTLTSNKQTKMHRLTYKLAEWWACSPTNIWNPGRHMHIIFKSFPQLNISFPPHKYLEGVGLIKSRERHNILRERLIKLRERLNKSRERHNILRERLIKLRERLVSRGNDLISRGNDIIFWRSDLLSGGIDLLSWGNDIISWGNDLPSWGNDLLSRGNDFITWGNNLLSRENDLLRRGNDLLGRWNDIINFSQCTSPFSHTISGSNRWAPSWERPRWAVAKILFAICIRRLGLYFVSKICLENRATSGDFGPFQFTYGT